MVWVLVGMLLVLFGFVISLDNCVELCILGWNGQKWTNIGLVTVMTGFHTLVVCNRNNM
jgi:hypothetical protein